MNKLLMVLIFSLATVAQAATTDENKDDGSAIGTSDSPQVQRQMDSTDKGATGVHQGGVTDDASNLGTSETPQVQRQHRRTDKGVSERPHKKAKNKVMQKKQEDAGTTKGNPVQPTEPEAAPPSVN